ncbi:hypothetical protein [Microseira sp. BLCC-F43]|uniref:hypothetical protein n=1 Tax=Microseira sp. BLCC-F43 TaxID=3153602 RepID=UPI0035B8A946
MTTSTNGDNQSFEQRLESIESRLDRLEGEFRDQAGLLLDGLRALSAQTTNLANRQQQLAETMVQLARNAEADRAIIRENQTEIRRIWEYLLRQSGNGQQPT